MDWNDVDPTTAEQHTANYPIAQWVNGDPKLAAVGGVAWSGGVALPTKYVGESLVIPGWTRGQMTFASGKTEDVLSATKFSVAVIRKRFRWFVKAGGQTTYFPRTAYDASAGMKGHLQLLVALPGLEFPVAITFTGTASREAERILK